ncbi:lipoprotein insertase outer membrane protein LolB [Shewanella sp. YIC-542]|uniref:lipoprotein insertase outer membrane protein LolB n=1 Tax=Shewanella mytili TaxID=3377111 RepID=UPI00398E483A
MNILISITNYLFRNMMRPLWLCGACLWWVSGCSTLADNWTPVTVSQPQEAQAWELRGKLAVKSPQESFSTHLYWRHTPDKDDVRLTTMLGTSVLTLTSQKGYAKLEVNGSSYEGEDPQALLNRLSHWQFPLTQLPQWILGIVGNDAQQLSRDPDGRPLQLTDSSVLPPWRIQYQSWQTQSGTEIPRLLRLNRGTLQLKIQLTQWQALASFQVPMDNNQ